MTYKNGTDNGVKRLQHKCHIGKYEIIRMLGQGGEGLVYLAYDRSLDRFAAIKKVGEDKAQADERIVKEAEFLQKLRHPMLPVVYDLFREDAWYLVMEYVQGITLRDYIAHNGAADEQKACAWAGQLADILEYLHTQETPVIYCDLKPDNIMVCPDGNLKLVDFGAAYRRNFGADRADVMAATNGYAAPEQFGQMGVRGQLAGHGGTGRHTCGYADERSDIYALGKVLYYVVTGADPGEPPYALLSVREYQPVLSSGLERLIGKCMEEEPQKRYQTAAQVRKDLSGCGKGKYVPRRRGFIKAVEKRIWLREKSDNSGGVLLDIKNV